MLLPHNNRLLRICILELWSELISKLQQQRSAIGLDKIPVDNISPYKVFGVSLVGVVIC